MRRHRSLLLLIGVLLAVMLACGPSLDLGGPSSQEMTAQALLSGPTNAPPTFTPPPGATAPPDAATAPPAEATVPPQPTAGEDQSAARGTATAAAATRDAELAASNALATTEAANELATLAPIEAELRAMGIDPAQGQLGWVHPPVEITVSGYQQYDWDVDLVRVVRDFVIAADITWNTTFGSTGCGFAMRSDGKEENITQFLTVATRGGSGRVIFATQIEGNVVRDDSIDIYANGIDPLFDWQNDTTNRIAVIGRGNTFSFYSNGTYLGDFTPANVIERGLVAFVALNESGTTYCRFENAFLWQFNE